jgi:hypothetical protein
VCIDAVHSAINKQHGYCSTIHLDVNSASIHEFGRGAHVHTLHRTSTSPRGAPAHTVASGIGSGSVVTLPSLQPPLCESTTRITTIRRIVISMTSCYAAHVRDLHGYPRSPRIVIECGADDLLPFDVPQ